MPKAQPNEPKFGGPAASFGDQKKNSSFGGVQPAFGGQQNTSTMFKPVIDWGSTE